MELRVLQYFLVVAREENITRAARLLHITQPTLSRQLMQLEEDLGVSLFRRSKHSIILTDEGRLLRRRAQELVELADKTERELQQKEDVIAGEIAVGCGEFMGNTQHLARLAASFRQIYPDVYFTFYTATADDVKDRMDEGLLDFGVLLEPVDISRYHFMRMPYKETWSVLVRGDHPLARQKTVSPADLIGQPIVTGKRKNVKNLLENWFGPWYDEIHIVGEMNLSANNKKYLVQEGFGLGIGVTMAQDSDDFRYIPLEPPMESACVLAWKKQQALSPVVQAFIDYAASFPQDANVQQV